MIILVYKKAYFNANDLDFYASNVIVSLLYEFNNVFIEEIPSGLPLIRRIEHQIDLVPKATIPNRLPY
jgi:hypothetical protein